MPSYREPVHTGLNTRKTEQEIGGETYFSDCVGITEMINMLDLLNDEVCEDVADALKQGANVIANEQKRIIGSKSAKLASLINSRTTYSVGYQGKIGGEETYHPVMSVRIGYDYYALKEAPEAIIMEFGKPSKNANRGNRVATGKIKTITISPITGKTYKRAIKETKIATKGGLKVDSLGRVIGYVPALPHIRKGFDSKADEAVELTKKALDNAIKRWNG